MPEKGTDLFFRPSRSALPAQFDASLNARLDLVDKCSPAGQLSSQDGSQNGLSFLVGNALRKKVTVLRLAFGILVSQGKVKRIFVEPTDALDSCLRRAARPGVGGRVIAHSGRHRIHVHVTAAGQQVMAAVDGALFEATFPQGAAAAFQVVHIAGLAAGDTLHEAAQILRFGSRVDNQVHVVCHQAESVELAAESRFPFGEVVEIVVIVVIAAKDDLAVVTTLDHVVGLVGEDCAGRAWHGANPRIRV